MPNPWIRKLETFAPLSEDDKRHLDGLVAHAFVVEADQDIISEGDAPEHVHLIVEGFACRYKMLPDGERQILAHLIPGDICDLHIFILKQMDHAIGALSRTKVVYIPREAILSIQESRPALARALWWSTLQDESVLREWLVNMGRRDAYQRIGHVLSEIYTRMQVIGLAEDHMFELPITQDELADSVGLTPVHVNRTLQRLRQDGLIEQKGRRLTILDREGLARATGFHPLYLHLEEKGGEGSSEPKRG